ncbi:MAG: dihydroorotase [Moorellales bacterium]
MDWLIRGGRVVDPAQGLDDVRDVLILGGRIAMVGFNLKPPPHVEELEAVGKVVAPGFIDLHVHLREPGQEDKETIETGLRAAAMGGFTAVCCMPNTEPPLDSPTAIAYVVKRGAEVNMSRLYPIANVTKGGRGEELTEMAELAQAGAVAFSDDGRPVVNSRIMRYALEYSRLLGRPIIDHCEDLELSRGGQMNEGPYSYRWGIPGIPAAAEEIMVARDLRLAALTGGRLHLAHLSTRGSIRLLEQAKAEDLPVTAEVTPHHLLLTEEAVRGYDTSAKVNPPLRTQEDVTALREAVAGGLVDVIASDHAPHTRQEKETAFEAAPFGISGLETLVPLIVTFMVLPGIINWSQAVSLLSWRPARVLGVPGGSLSPGQPADLTIVDPDLELPVNPEQFQSQGRNTPFRGWRLRGWPVATMVGGRLVMRGRRITWS